jgi:hypothetical protein
MHHGHAGTSNIDPLPHRQRGQPSPQVTQLFRVELHRERGGIDQITEHHRQLPSLGFG